MASKDQPRGSWLQGSDLTGMTCHYLKVVGRAERPPDAKAKTARGTWWRCVCVCGKERIVPRNYIVTKSINSCGCKSKPPLPMPARKPEKQENETPKGDLSGFGRLCRCKLCGKTFEKIYRDWGYSIGDKLYCTYKCMREAEKERKKNGK